MVLLDNREVRQGWEPLKTSVTGLFAKHGVEIVSARRWQERRLAYPIKHQLRGTYMLVYFQGEPESIQPIRRELELNEAVMRNLLLTCEQVPDEAHQPEEEFDVSQVQIEDVYQAPAPPRAPEEEEAEGAEPSADKKGEGEKGKGEKSEGKKGEGDAALTEATDGDKPASPTETPTETPTEPTTETTAETTAEPTAAPTAEPTAEPTTEPASDTEEAKP